MKTPVCFGLFLLSTTALADTPDSVPSASMARVGVGMGLITGDSPQLGWSLRARLTDVFELEPVVSAHSITALGTSTLGAGENKIVTDAIIASSEAEVGLDLRFQVLARGNTAAIAGLGGGWSGWSESYQEDSDAGPKTEQDTATDVFRARVGFGLVHYLRPRVSVSAELWPTVFQKTVTIDDDEQGTPVETEVEGTGIGFAPRGRLMLHLWI